MVRTGIFLGGVVVAAAWAIFSASGLHGQPIKADAVDRWVTASEGAAGTGLAAQDEAVKAALRKAVEQACGVFLAAQSKAQDYQAVYDKILANTVGYVIEYKVIKTWEQDGITFVRVNAHVSTQKFQESWANIAHTLHQEGNPRVIVAIAELTGGETVYRPAEKADEAGVVQTKIEDFLLSHGVQLMDRSTGEKVDKRDILLASGKQDLAAIAVIGARFKADVVIIGQATAKYGQRVNLAGQDMHQYLATLTVRAVRTDSAQLLVSKTFGPMTVNTLQVASGDQKALAKLGEESAPKLLEAVVEAWRKQVQVRRNIQLEIAGMDFKAWKAFETEAKAIRGIQALRRREITEAVATIDVEYDYGTDNLADRLGAMKTLKLDVTEITANRIRMKLTGIAQAPDDKEKPPIEGKPVTEEKPAVEMKPKTPEMPTTAPTPKTEETPKAEEKPKTPDTPKAEEKPKTPDTPKAEEKPKSPSLLDRIFGRPTTQPTSRPASQPTSKPAGWID